MLNIRFRYYMSEDVRVDRNGCDIIPRFNFKLLFKFIRYYGGGWHGFVNWYDRCFEYTGWWHGLTRTASIKEKILYYILYYSFFWRSKLR